MRYMKNRSILIVTALLMAVSCSNDEIMHLQQGAPIEFRAVMNRQTKATPFTAVNLTSFNVTAWDDEDDSYYYEQVDYTRGDDGSYTSDMDYYWPVTGSLVFYAYSPKASAGNGITRISEKSFSVTPTSNVDDQVDLIFAKNSGSKTANSSTGVELNFRHTMADIHIHVKNSENKADFTVTGWKIVGADGTAVFTCSDTVTSTNASAQNAANTLDRGMWSDNDDDYSVSYVKTFTGRDIDASTTNGQALDGSAILIPQLSAKATGYSGSDPSDNPLNGAYIAIQYGATDASTSVQMVPAGTWGCWPVTFDWAPGYRYNYTIDLADFGYKETGEDELDPVYFDHTVINFVELSVDPWQPEGGTDIVIPFEDEYPPYLRIHTEGGLQRLSMSRSTINESSNVWTKLQYSLDEGVTWSNLYYRRGLQNRIEFGYDGVENHDLLIRGKNGFSNNTAYYSSFSFEVANQEVECYGSVGCLSDYENPTAALTEPRQYQALFYNCKALVKAPDLPATELTAECYSNMFSYSGIRSIPELPADVLANGCYEYMFTGCNNLRGVKVLPATELANRCYMGMFIVCNNLETAPELPATELKDSCYSSMFEYCHGLKKAPELPAMELTKHCYAYMFSDCSSLVTAPDLPAATLVEECYTYMFEGCSSLITAPEISATTLYPSCFESMFSGCTSLVYAPTILPATTLKNCCYMNMFAGCTSLTTAPVLPATTVLSSCYKGMFSGCTSLTTVPDLPATVLEGSAYCEMFKDCSSLVVAPAISATDLSFRCCMSMFEGCTSLVETPVLPADVLSENCYASMFAGCTGLKKINTLSASTLAIYCYKNMFSGCTSLTTAPALSAHLSYGCYEGMFSYCTALTTAPELPELNVATSCYASMFKGCTSLRNAPVLPALSLRPDCYKEMFRDCSSLNYLKAMFVSDEATVYSLTSCDHWLDGVASTGTFVKHASAEWLNDDERYSIPSGWTVVLASE